MKTLSHSLFLLPLTLLAASCAVSHPPQPADNPNFVLPDIPREPLHEKSIPYPRLDAQTQIDHLGIQIARLERTVEELNQRLHTTVYCGFQAQSPAIGRPQAENELFGKWRRRAV